MKKAPFAVLTAARLTTETNENGVRTISTSSDGRVGHNTASVTINGKQLTFQDVSLADTITELAIIICDRHFLVS